MCSAKIYEFKNQNPKVMAPENVMLDVQGIDIYALTKILKRLNEDFESNKKFDLNHRFDEILKELNNVAHLKAELVNKFGKLKVDRKINK
jgi:hypothetical protein